MTEYIEKDIAIQICMDAWDTGEASQNIKDEPSADVVPIVHSGWEHFKVNGQYKIRCKYCDYIEPEYRSYVRDYCPCCGAKMDKESRDE